jgi:beta-galactosidase
LPARLLNVPDIKLRSFNTPFLDEVYIYFKSLAPVIEPFLEVNKGPIVYLQIEN